MDDTVEAEVPFFGEFEDGDEQGWQPTDEIGATRLLRHLGRVQAEMAEHRALYAAEKEALDLWLEDRVSGLLRVEAGVKRALESWARMAHPGESGHVFNLPSGKLTLTAARESIEVVDEAAAVGWCEANERPDLVKKELAAGEVKKLVRAVADPEDLLDGRKSWQAATEDGELIPGIRLVKADKPTFTVKPGGKVES